MEQEIIQEAKLEWQLECSDKIQKYKDKIKKTRNIYRSRYDLVQKKLEIHVRKNNQRKFMDEYSPKVYHTNMEGLLEKKRKDLNLITKIVEQYDFYFKNIIINELTKDQS